MSKSSGREKVTQLARAIGELAGNACAERSALEAVLGQTDIRAMKDGLRSEVAILERRAEEREREWRLDMAAIRQAIATHQAEREHALLREATARLTDMGLEPNPKSCELDGSIAEVRQIVGAFRDRWFNLLRTFQVKAAPPYAPSTWVEGDRQHRQLAARWGALIASQRRAVEKPGAARPLSRAKESLEALSPADLEVVVRMAVVPMASDAQAEAEMGLGASDPLDELLPSSR